MKTDYCKYPPQIASDVEVAEQLDGERSVRIVSSASVGRYILLRETEFNVLSLLDEALTPAAVCDEFFRQYGETLPLATLTRFLTKLDQVGILAGERAQGHEAWDQQLSQQFYVRLKLFNPDQLFGRLIRPLRWIWTTEFFAATVLLMLAVFLMSLTNWAEVSSYGVYILREHYVAVLVVGLLIGVTHEFAHGMTCKAFGGRSTEVGVLMIYYFIPALYCNVSGVHSIPKRGRRLWVIAAGVYWQLLVGTFSLLAWFVVAPHTLLSDLAFISFFGSVLDVIFNGNPLIKLDGYYFLSQWLGVPNLMDRSRAYWRSLLRSILFGERNADAAQHTRRERAIYATFGLLSFSYTVGLRFFIVVFVGGYLVRQFQLFGLLLAAGLALLFVRQPLNHILSGTFNSVFRALKLENKMATNDQATVNSAGNGKTKALWSRRRLVPLTLALLVAATLLAPWSASVGNYGKLIALPDHEAVIRASESATLVALRVQPGDRLARGAVVGQMGNLEVDDQITQVQSDIARVQAESERLVGEMRAKGETAVRADLQSRQRERDYNEIHAEQRQIASRQGTSPSSQTFTIIPASTGTSLSLTSQVGVPPAELSYPAALAVLEADVEMRRAQLNEAGTHSNRARRLHFEGLMARSELDAAETRVRTLASELSGASNRLEAALIEHRRRHASTTTEMKVAYTEASTERLQIEKLNGELRGLRGLTDSLTERRNLLERKRAQFELLTPLAGVVFGEDLPRLVGQYFQKGAEICRIADTRQLLLRIQVPEREIGDVQVGSSVRLKARAFPDRVFRGVVSKIGGESERDENQQSTYRVELTIENGERLLRPGMTAFARIDFGRQMIGRILIHKIKQALRPELWML
jgi:putative peptide zinc metalloprotease protein